MLKRKGRDLRTTTFQSRGLLRIDREREREIKSLLEMDKGRLICKERMDGGVVQLEAVLHQKRPMIRRVRLLGERTLSDAPATGRTMKGHLTAASHGDLRCCVKYIGRFSFLFVSSPFFGFCVALQSSYLTDLDRSAR